VSLIYNKAYFRHVTFLLIAFVFIITITDTCQVKAKDPVNLEQTKVQIELFREALDNFGASSPEQVINIWIKGVKGRNGALHYAVACHELKQKFVEEWGEPKESLWVYGTSSPWLYKHEVVYSRKLSDVEYEVKLKYFWHTSTGLAEPTETVLRIVRTGDIWCVQDVK